MRIQPNTFLALLAVGAAILGGAGIADAQEELARISLKNGQTVQLRTVYFIRNCRSILKETPIIEVLEGPEELTLTIKPGMVVPRGDNCSNPVAGGTVVATANEVKAPKESRLT